MDLAPSAVEAMIRLAFDRLTSAATRAGERVSTRPPFDGANSIYGIGTHCIGVTEYWLDHALLGRPSHRDRPAEFEATGSVDDLQSAVDELLARIPDVLAEIDRLDAPRTDPLGDRRPPWPWTPAGVVLHVIEELFQHAGHADITADLLSEPPIG